MQEGGRGDDQNIVFVVGGWKVGGFTLLYLFPVAIGNGSIVVIRLVLRRQSFRRGGTGATTSSSPKHPFDVGLGRTSVLLPLLNRVIGVPQEIVDFRRQIVGGHFRIGERRTGFEHMPERLPSATENERDFPIDYRRRGVERGELIDIERMRIRVALVEFTDRRCRRSRRCTAAGMMIGARISPATSRVLCWRRRHRHRFGTRSLRHYCLGS